MLPLSFSLYLGFISRQSYLNCSNTFISYSLCIIVMQPHGLRCKRHQGYKERIFSHYFSSNILHSHQTNYIPDMKWRGVCARLNKANLFKGWSSGWGTPQSYIHYICDFTLLTGALSCGRFHLCVWWWLREKAGIVLCGLQACSQLRRVSQWRVGGRLNVRRTWPRSHSLMQPCVWPLSLSPSDSVCLYPSVSSFSLCLRCTRHLVWLHICGYSVYKARTAAPFVQ